MWSTATFLPLRICPLELSSSLKPHCQGHDRLDAPYVALVLHSNAYAGSFVLAFFGFAAPKAASDFAASAAGAVASVTAWTRSSGAATVLVLSGSFVVRTRSSANCGMDSA